MFVDYEGVHISIQSESHQQMPGRPPPPPTQAQAAAACALQPSVSDPSHPPIPRVRYAASCTPRPRLLSDVDGA